MVDAKHVAEIVDSLAPFSTSAEWDNTGLLLDCGNTTNGILFALDVTPETLHEAVRLDCGILVAHHPVMIAPKSRFTANDAVICAAANGISLIAAHTNYDAAPGGVNDVLVSLLGIQNAVPFGVWGRGGDLPADMTEKDFVKLVQKRLGCVAPLIVSAGKPIRRVAVLGGGGGSEVAAAIDGGYDAYLTGEISHHHGLAAKTAGLCVVCAGHFVTENLAMEPLCNAVAAKLGSKANCILSRENTDPFTYYR